MKNFSKPKHTVSEKVEMDFLLADGTRPHVNCIFDMDTRMILGFDIDFDNEGGEPTVNS